MRSSILRCGGGMKEFWDVSITQNMAFVGCPTNRSRFYSIYWRKNDLIGLKFRNKTFLTQPRALPGWWCTCKRITSRKGMTEHENEIVKSLCARINEEKDSKVFAELVIELNLLLDKVLGLSPGPD
jgi:hypothetical protein